MASMPVSTASRVAAALIAATAWTGLAIQLVLLCRTHTLPAALGVMFAYFTITTNTLVAVVFSALALGRATPLRAPSLIAGTALSILLVGVVVVLLLRGLLELSGGSALVDRLLHVATPVAVPLFWLAWTPKGTLRLRDPLLWAVYPLAYLAFALVRGASTGQYSYPFLNVAQLGPARVTSTAVLIALGFILTGYAVVWLDHRLGRRSA